MNVITRAPNYVIIEKNRQRMSCSSRKWRNFYFFVEVNGKPTCLICTQQVAVAKKYNIWRHYDTNHAVKYDKHNGKLLEAKAAELEQSLKKQQSVFKSAHQISDAAVMASYMTAHKLAVSS